MSLYACNRCTAVENTALGQYWGADEKLCSECATGTWHGRFPRRLLKDTNYVARKDGTLEPPGGWPKPLVNSTWGGHKPMTTKLDDSPEPQPAEPK